MELVKKYSYNVVLKALKMKLKLHKETDKYIIILAPTQNSENKFYRLTYDKLRDEFNCECQEFFHKRKCSHSLSAIRIVKGMDNFWEESSKNRLK